MKRKVEVFICYASEDEQMLLELIKHLKVLQQQGIINLWHNRNISAGVDWELEINLHLNKAELILMLISPDFMNSDYCYSVEIKHAMERHLQGEARVIPIILRPVHWQWEPLSKLQTLPKDGIPIINEKWHHQDDAFYNVVEGIMEILGTGNPLDSVSQSPEVIPDEQKSPQSNAVSHLVEGKASDPKGVEKQRLHILSTRAIPAIPTIIAAIMSILLLSFLLITLFPLTSIQCSYFICSAIQKPNVTDLDEVSDQNLDAHFSRQRSTSFELPGALERYTLGNLPDSIAAVRSDGVQSSPYRLIIGVKNLHQTGYELYIDKVSLLVYDVPPLANPLNVWNRASLTSNAVLYSLTYAGQPAGSELDTTYEPVPSLPSLLQRLQPGETDYVGLQVDPALNLQADLRFHVSITYRMANEGQEATLMLPRLFEVVFSNANNWHVHNF